jgi:hypothetical protein
MATDRDKINEITQAVYSGTLASKIKKNASYTVMGVLLGGVLGAIGAGFLGKGRLMGAAMGAAIFGLGGFLVSNNNIKKD